MSTPTRSSFSAVIGPGLTLLTAASAFINGPVAASTTVAFGLTIVWGIIEIALLSYTPIASIDLDGPSLLEEQADDRLVAFSAHARDQTPRAA